ncbi:MAG: hypothetical protein KG003_04785 [Bacteroidetes bacterium]|nr:hypothetical protein [Bacteroidota bacterium]
MDTKQTFKGHWFLPDYPESQLTGTLTFDPEMGIELELLGIFENVKRLADHEPEIILGFTSNGKKITLYRCFATSRTSSFLGMETTTYKIIYLLKGAHFETPTSLQFHSLRASVHNLGPWIDITGFRTVKFDDKLKQGLVEYEIPPAIEFTTMDSILGKLDFDVSYPISRYTNKVELEQTSTVVFKSELAVPFKDMMGYYFHFQDFLTLAAFEATFPLSIELVNNCLKDKVLGTERTPLIEVYFKHSIRFSDKKPKISRQFLFNYKDIETNFTKIIGKWFSIKALSKPVVGLLLDGFYNSGSFSENNFLNTAQGVETFHRRFRNNRVFSKADYKKRMNAIIDSVDSEYKEWLKAKLQFGYEPTLHQRLEELIEEQSNETIAKIVSDKDQFIRDVKNSRNYYIHYNPELKKKALDVSDLYYINEKLRIILTCSLLSEVGFTQEQIASLLRRNEWYLFNHILESK